MSLKNAPFIVRKLHSLTGIVPIGTFLMAHLYINCSALLGECAFTDGVRTVSSLPYVHYIEWGGIVIPIAFHAAIGLWMIFREWSFNVFSYSYARNWWYTIQRLSGLVLVLFLGWHLWDLFWRKMMGGIHIEGFYNYLSESISSNRLVLAAFVAGTLAASFHLSNGLWGFCASWGILQSRKAQRIGGWVFGLVGIALFFAWLNVTYHFASGGGSLIHVQEPPFECASALLSSLEG